MIYRYFLFGCIAVGVGLIFYGLYLWADSGFVIELTDAVGANRRDTENIHIPGLWYMIAGAAISAYVGFEILLKNRS